MIISDIVRDKTQLDGLTGSPIFLIIFVIRLAAAEVNGTRDNSVNPIKPIGQFFQPVSPENHTDGLNMRYFSSKYAD
ncbi:hypothetical protein BpHYR1_004735 [Brachionus plicatilis]|uniref:Uncharacterized protein n=1 Tax=Brachionus plicatilis TaxID=10195 RepID=A0A3M7QVD8_BRAPC|nr:hypothetical protein BpHYR1_004735 [Brachionus plicatilis]